MINFSTHKLKEDFLEAIKKLSFLKGEIDGIDLKSFLVNLEDYDDLLIEENTEILLDIGTDELVYIDVIQFVDMAKNKSKMKINDVHSYAKSEKEIYFLLDTSDYNTYMMLDNTFRRTDKATTILEKCEDICGKKYSVGLFRGFNMFHLLVEESGMFNDFCPSYSSEDYFVRIQCDSGIDMKIVDSLAVSYVFELQTSFDIVLPFSAGRIDLDTIDKSDESLIGKESMMFPLITGTGTGELLNLYNTAKTTYDLDFKILGFTKVIEYIAPTISQKNLIEDVTLKLTSPCVFRPTAAFVFELGAIYEKYRNTSSKDIELIKSSVLTAVTVDDTWEYVPEFLKTKQKPVELKEQEAFLEKIAESIYSTRNEIAHAKANYEKRGTECPKRQKETFCELLDIVAVRCIRWFALQPEDKRVVLG